MWRYDDGYKGADSSLTQLQFDEDYKQLRGAVAKCLRDRHNQYLMPFGFWPKVRMRSESSIYEMRNYELKPGTMVEWGNYWAKAIGMRDHKDKEPFMGLFSQVLLMLYCTIMRLLKAIFTMLKPQVGDLYNVRHIWCYDNMEERRAARENVWQRQQSRWEDIVANTMPLVRKMNSRIMKPLPHSPTK